MAANNPYQSPSESGYVAPQSPEQPKIARNIRAICVLYIVFGGLAILGGIGGLVANQGKMPWFAPYTILALGLCGVISAVGVLRRRRWGLLFCQVMSAIYLLSFPIGTILGGYFLFNIGKLKSEFR